MKQIQLSHGGGGEQMNLLIEELIYKYLGNDILLSCEDAALLSVGKNIAFSTDSFIVSPIFFNGGDIGKLCVAGSVNDVSMMGAKALYLSLGLIIEEGFSLDELEKIIKSIAKEAQKIGVKIVTGDTKVAPKGKVDKIFINTSCIGEIICEGLGAKNLKPKDKIIISNFIGDHGACIMASREELALKSELKSDCACLSLLTQDLFSHIKPVALRDATRGGISAVLNEWAKLSQRSINIHEEQIPIRDEVRGICEFLGFEPFELANEGTFVLAVKPEDANKALDILHAHEIGKKASIIGEVSDEDQPKVTLFTPWGSSRYLEAPKGELLPRIC